MTTAIGELTADHLELRPGGVVTDPRDNSRGLGVEGEVANSLSGGMREVCAVHLMSLRESREPGEDPIELTLHVGHREPWRWRNERMASRPVWAICGPWVNAAVV